MVVGGGLKDCGTDGTRETHWKIKNIPKYIVGKSKGVYFSRSRLK
jgi:hypothetical protein